MYLVLNMLITVKFKQINLNKNIVIYRKNNVKHFILLWSRIKVNNFSLKPNRTPTYQNQFYLK